MKNILMLGAAGVVLAGIVVAVIMLRRRPRKLKTVHFQERWRELQKMCASKETWAQAVIDADALLEEALKRKRFGGKTMGERLTKAQRLLTDNEGVWFGHKLRTKLETEPDTKLKETDIKQALLGIRQALKDLGALPNDK